MSGVNSSAAAPGRLPPAADGVQVNFCKNPACSNYGVLPLDKIARGRPQLGQVSDTYILGAGGASYPRFNCRLCGESLPLKSNFGIVEERDRFLRDADPREEASCPDPTCANHGVSIGAEKGHYQRFGVTHSGSKRYRCKACRKTFAVGKSTIGHKQPHKNKLIFSLLMNKSPMRRICEVADIGASGLYGKIDFLYQQCNAFVAARERRLMDGMAIPRVYLASDRQDYMVNWKEQTDKRNVVLHALGTADNKTGYVFALHLNYDQHIDTDDVEQAAIAAGDYQNTPPFRKFARCWLELDYKTAAARQANKNRRVSKATLQGAIAATYAEAAQRDDVEIAETVDSTQRLPAKGVQIHAEYTLYGHYLYLDKLLPGVEKFRFFLDQDSGMRAACLAGFQPRIKARTADAFYVRIAKELTVSQKRSAMAASRAQFDALKKLHPGLSDGQLEVLLIKQAIAHMATLGKWQDRWLTHPLPDMSEPEKAVCYLTDFGDYDPDHLARLYQKASLHGIDRFFMQVRRRLSILERPIATANTGGRNWYGYGAYNPASIVKLLGIYRVFYNYCAVGADKQTPAMRLGLAKGKVELEDIIYY
jgi:hypothetical protein